MKLFYFSLFTFTEDKKIYYADFLTPFELLYTNTIMFGMRIENRKKIKSKDISIFFEVKTWFPQS